MRAEHRLQRAKRRAKELLNHNANDWEDRALEDHRRQVDFDKRRMKLMTMIVLAEDDALTEEAAPRKEAASDNKEQRPDEGTAPTVRALKTVAACNEAGQNDASSYNPDLKNEAELELPWEAKVPDPFEVPWHENMSSKKIIILHFLLCLPVSLLSFNKGNQP